MTTPNARDYSVLQWQVIFKWAHPVKLTELRLRGGKNLMLGWLLRLSDNVLNGAGCLLLGHALLRARIRLGAAGEHHCAGLWLRLERDQLRLLVVTCAQL